MRRSLARFSGPDSLDHKITRAPRRTASPLWSNLRFSVHTTLRPLERLRCLSLICLPQSSACQRSLVEVRPTIPVCTLVGSGGLCVRLGLSLHQTLSAVPQRDEFFVGQTAQTNRGSFSKYAPPALPFKPVSLPQSN